MTRRDSPLSTFVTSSPSILTVPLSYLSFTHACIPSFSFLLSFIFSPMHISSCSAYLLPIPFSRYRLRCHPQTSWSILIEPPVLSYLSSYPSLLQTTIIQRWANRNIQTATIVTIIQRWPNGALIVAGQGPKADHWCIVPLSLRTRPSLIPHTSSLLYCHHTYCVLFSRASIPLTTFSCKTTLRLLAQCHKLSRGRQTHDVAHSDPLLTS